MIHGCFYVVVLIINTAPSTNHWYILQMRKCSELKMLWFSERCIPETRKQWCRHEVMMMVLMFLNKRRKKQRFLVFPLLGKRQQQWEFPGFPVSVSLYIQQAAWWCLSLLPHSKKVWLHHQAFLSGACSPCLCGFSPSTLLSSQRHTVSVAGLLDDSKSPYMWMVVSVFFPETADLSMVYPVIDEIDSSSPTTLNWISGRE